MPRTTPTHNTQPTQRASGGGLCLTHEDQTMRNANTSTRTPGGRFAPGNPGGPGNPHAATVAKLRAAILAAVTPEDIDAIVRALVHRAKGGDLGATKELLDRAIGKPTDGDLAERINELERVAESLMAEGGGQ